MQEIAMYTIFFFRYHLLLTYLKKIVYNYNFYNMRKQKCMVLKRKVKNI